MKETLHIGDWCIEPALLRVSSGVSEARVEPKVLQVLLCLAEQPGEVVTREALLDAVWGSAHGSEELLRRAVYELRKLFGDDARAPRFIETVPRSGYRLLVPVHHRPRTSLPEASAQPVRQASPKPRERAGLLFLTGAAVALVAVVVIAALVFQQTRSVAAPPRVNAPVPPMPRLVPITSAPGLEFDPDLSPDGARVAFVRTSSELTDHALEIAQPGDGASLELFRTEGWIASPRWSADASHIVFAAGDRDGTGLWSISTLGGRPRKLSDLGQHRVAGLDLTADGKAAVLALRPAKGLVPWRLHRIAFDGSAPTVLSDPPPTTVGDRWPRVSPDGAGLAFVRTRIPLVEEVFVLPMVGGQIRRVTPRPLKVTGLAWSPGGDELMATVFDAGRHRLWRLALGAGASARSGNVRRIALGEGAMDLTWRGDRVVYSRYAWRFAIERVDLESGVRVVVDALSSTHFDAGLDLSPDGRRLALASSRSGDFEIWEIDLPGSVQPRRLTELTETLAAEPRYAPDGHRIAFTSTAGGDVDIWMTSTDGIRPRRLTQHPAADRQPEWSADGRTLFFASDRSGAWKIWRVAVDAGPGSEAVLVTSGERSRASHDGTWLYFIRREAALGGVISLWRHHLAEGREEQILAKLGASHSGNWALRAGAVYYLAKGAEPGTALWRLDLETREAEIVAELGASIINPSLGLALDGSSAYVARLISVDSDLLMLEGAR